MTEGPYKLPEGWRWVKLGEVSLKPEYGYTASAITEPRGPKFLRITDITTGVVDWEKVPYCEADEKTLIRYKVNVGDVLFARSGSIGAAIVIRELPPEPTVFASYLIRVRLREGILPEYMEWLIKTPLCQSQLIPRGAAQKNINTKHIQQLLIPLPPLPEQRRIVARIEELMGRVREARRLREEARQDAERLWQSVLAETFPRPGSALPAGWRWVKLGEVCETKMGGTPSTKIKEYWDPPEVVWVTPEDLEKSQLNRVSTSRRLISRLGLDKSNAKLFPRGTVLLSTTATIGKVGIAEIQLSANQQITGIICGSHVISEFLAYYLLSVGETGLREFGGTATATHINQTNLRSLPIPLPPLAEQQRIVAQLEELQKKLQVLKEVQVETDQQLVRLEQTILNYAFQGML